MSLSLLRLFFLFSTAISGEPREPRELPIKPCDQAILRQCTDRYAAAAEEAGRRARGVEPRLSALELDLISMQKSFDLLFIESAARHAIVISLADERKFLERPASKASSAILPGPFLVDDLFTLHPLDRSWRERYPLERAAKVTVALADARREEEDTNSRVSSIATRKSAVNNEYQSALAQKNSWLAEARQHEGMCREGCRESLCPARN